MSVNLVGGSGRSLTLLAGGTGTGFYVTNSGWCGVDKFLEITAGTQPTPDAGTACFYSALVAGKAEMFAIDELGNATQLSPHAADAPAFLYEIGPGADEMDKRSNVFLAVINWHAVTRRKAIDALDFAGRLGTQEQSSAAWTEILARQQANHVLCDVTESFADYQVRTGISPWLKPVWAAMTSSQRWGGCGGRQGRRIEGGP